MSAKNQIDKLANFIMAEFPEHIKGGGAGDVAIEAMKALRKRVIELEGLIATAYDVAFNSPELNMSNYDHEQVSELNTAMCEVCSILENGVSTPPEPEA